MVTKENLYKVARIALALMLGILTVAAANAANRRVQAEGNHTRNEDTGFTARASYIDMECVVDEVGAMRSELGRTLNRLYKVLTLSLVGIALLVVSILVAVLCS
jgi:hypothetical protein